MSKTIKQLSAKNKAFKVEFDASVSIPEYLVEETESSYIFTYYKVVTRDRVYRIDEDTFTAKYEAIKKGAKFLEFGDDLVNVNEIKTFEKKVAHKQKSGY